MPSTITMHLLKEADNLQLGGMFEAHTHTATLIIEECGTLAEGEDYTLTSATRVRNYLADETRQAEYAAEVGSEFLYWTGSAWDGFLRNTEYGSWRVRSIKVDSVRDRENTYRVTITSTNMGKMANDAESPLLLGAEQCTSNSVARTRQVNAWRAGTLTFPVESAGTLADDPDPSVSQAGRLYDNCPGDWQLCHTGQDCGGNRIDINGGNPTQYNTGQEQVTLEYVMRMPWLNWSTQESLTQWANLYLIRNLINTRNAEPWFGYDAGYLLVSDVAVQPMHHEFKRVTITLLYDEWKHANQRPWVTKSGVVAATDTCEASDVPVDEEGLPNLTAEQVWWVQPYQQLGSLGIDPATYLFPDGVWEQWWYQLDGTDGSGYAPKSTPDGCT